VSKQQCSSEPTKLILHGRLTEISHNAKMKHGNNGYSFRARNSRGGKPLSAAKQLYYDQINQKINTEYS